MKQDAFRSEQVGSMPWWIAAIVIAGAALAASGAVISRAAPTMLTGGAPMSAAASVYADYFFARNLPLAAMLIILLCLRARQALAGVMVLTALIQLMDVVNDLTRGQLLFVPGLLVFALAFAGTAAWLLRRPAGQAGARRELGEGHRA